MTNDDQHERDFAADLWVGAEDAFDEGAMPPQFLDLVRRAIQLMVDATAAGYSYAQVLTEADHVVSYANDEIAEGATPYAGDLSTYGHVSIERGTPDGWSWVVSPRSVREYMHGDPRLASLSDRQLRESIDFWMNHQDQSILASFENAVELAVDTAAGPPPKSDQGSENLHPAQ